MSPLLPVAPDATLKFYDRKLAAKFLELRMLTPQSPNVAADVSSYFRPACHLSAAHSLQVPIRLSEIIVPRAFQDGTEGKEPDITLDAPEELCFAWSEAIAKLQASFDDLESYCEEVSIDDCKTFSEEVINVPMATTVDNLAERSVAQEELIHNSAQEEMIYGVAQEEENPDAVQKELIHDSAQEVEHSDDSLDLAPLTCAIPSGKISTELHYETQDRALIKFFC